MWPFRKRTVRALYMTDSELAEVLGKITREVKELRDDVDAHHAQHVKLRGRVYAIWGKGEPEPDGATASPTSGKQPDTAKMSRDELKRFLASSGRFIPGRPAQHSE